MITTLLIATGLAAGPGQAATTDITRADGSGAGWDEIPTDPPTERVTLEDTWFDGSDMWTVGTVGTVWDGDGLPWITRCSDTACGPSQFELPPDTPAELLAVSGTSASDIWAVGSKHKPGSPQRRALAIHFDGTAWTEVPMPPPNHKRYEYFLSAVAAVSPTDVWVVGGEHYDSSWGGGAWTRGYSLHWDGEEWTEHHIPSQGCGYQAPNDLLLTDDHRIFTAAYCSTESVGERNYGFVMEFTELGWSTALTLHRDEGLRETELHSITEAGDEIWAVGRRFQWPLSHTRAIAYRLADGEWSRTPMPRRSALLSGAAGTEDGEVWAVGYRDGGTDEMRSVLHWADDQWTPIRTPGLGWLQDVALDPAGVPWVVGYQMHDWLHVDPVVLRRTSEAG